MHAWSPSYSGFTVASFLGRRWSLLLPSIILNVNQRTKMGRPGNEASFTVGLSATGSTLPFSL